FPLPSLTFLPTPFTLIITLWMDESIEKQLLLAGSFYSNGQYEEALQTYRETAKKWPENGIVRSNLSALLLKVSKVDEAIEEAIEAVRLSPLWYKTHYRLGECYRVNGRHLNALLSYSNGLAIDHSNGQLLDASLQSAIAHFKESFPLAALRRTQMTSNAVSILVCIGQCLLQQGVLSTSREILLNAYSLPFPSITVHSSLLSSLISVSSLLSLHESALKFAKEHYELCQNQGLPVISSLESISRECQSLGDLEGSLAARLNIIQYIEKNDPSRVSHILQSADLYLSLEMIEEAAKSYTSVLILDCSDCDRLSARAGLAFTVYHRGETREAIHLMEDLEMNAMDEKLRIRLIEFKSLAMMKEGTFDPNYLSKLLEESSHPATTAKLSFLLAQYFISCGNIESALKMVKKSLGISKRLEDFPLQASSLILLAQIYELNFDTESALSLLEHCLQLPKIPFKEKLQALHRISSLLESVNRLDESIERLEEAMKICTERGNENGIERSKSMMKTIRRKKEERDDLLINQRTEQSETLQEKLAEAQEMNNEVDEASICLSLGKIYEEENKFEEALHYFQQALTVSKQLRLVQMMGVSYLGVARILSIREEWSRVESCARAAVTMGRLMNDESMENEGMILIGKTQHNKGDKELARKVYLKVLRRVKEKNEDEKSAIIHFDVARISDEERAYSHFWSCFSCTNGVDLKMECLLHLSSLPSSSDPHSLLRATLAFAIGEGKMGSLLQLSRKERELDWIDHAIQTSSYAVMKYSDHDNFDSMIDELSSFHPRFSSSLLLSLYSKRKDRRILFTLFRTIPNFVLKELDNEEGEESLLLRSLCLSLMGKDVEWDQSLSNEDSNDRLGFSLSSFISQMEKRKKMIEEAPFLMVETIKSNNIDQLISQYDSLLLELTQFDYLPPQFAIDSFSFCTIVISLFIPSIDNLLHIMDLADWVLAGHCVPPPSSSTVPSIPFTRIFSCGNVSIIWNCTDEKSLSPSYYLSSSSSSSSHLEDTLLSLLQSQSLSQSPSLPKSLLVGMPPITSDLVSFLSSHIFCLYSPLSLHLHFPSSSLLIIDLDQIHSSLSPVRISKEQVVCPTLLVRKILSSDICICSIDSIVRRFYSPLLFTSTTIQNSDSKKKFAPSLLIITYVSSISSFLHSLLFLLFVKGTKTVIILPENISSNDVEKLIDEISRGIEVDMSSLLPSQSIIMGERLFTHRPSTVESLRTSLKRGCLTSDSPSSSFVSTLLNVVPPSVLDHFLHLPLDTNELNETYSRMKRGEIIPEIEEGIHRDSAIKLFNVIFNDHLFTLDDPVWESEVSDLSTALSHLHPPEIKDQPISSPPPRCESRGYQSEGDNGRNSMIESSSFPSQGKYSVSATDRSRKRRKGGKERKRSSSVNQSSRVHKST
ncbi:hypothetical protein PRIPAC_94100, partial [Pristionchus pacificus]